MQSQLQKLVLLQSQLTAAKEMQDRLKNLRKVQYPIPAQPAGAKVLRCFCPSWRC